ncbi:ABA4-like family protein [Geitlerinema sp. CS-897]|nr:ABA4-like family protein [Geitlerinema sp. CS-897]
MSKSNLPFVVLVGFYLYCISQSLNAESVEALANPSLSQIARFFGEEPAAATGWAHFLVMDLFVGRWIYWEGQKTGVWTRHSIALCLFAGPVGVLSHLVTVTLRDRTLGNERDSATNGTLEEKRPDAV